MDHSDISHRLVFIIMVFSLAYGILKAVYTVIVNLYERRERSLVQMFKRIICAENI